MSDQDTASLGRRPNVTFGVLTQGFMALFEKVLDGSASDDEAAQFRNTWDKVRDVAAPKGQSTGGEQVPVTAASVSQAAGTVQLPEMTASQDRAA
ncbi:MAG: hypothetical protein LBR80_16435 [Deltaproteobacteria bacterium]|jgi:hypothetical protein|nr:hypothetical protein [Deltaproteobacteria bacterium]